MATEDVMADAACDDVTKRPAVSRWPLLLLLTAAMIVSFADRTILALMVQPIKAELQLSDTALGVLTGFAFAAFYASAGLLMAQLADRGHRRLIVIGSLVTWSIMTALCGLARSFEQLLLARFGVGAGEAGIVPAAQSIVAETFPAHQRSTAMAILMAGGPLGILVAFLITGPIEASVGWRMTFVMMGLPGICLALAFVAVKIPQGLATRQAEPRNRAKLVPALREIWAIPRFRWTMAVIVTLSLLTFGQAQWLPAYLERSFAMPRAAVGPALALTQGIGMLAGTICGGPLFDRLGSGRVRRRAAMVGASCLAGLPLLLLVFMVQDAYLAAALTGVAAAILALPSGQLWAMVQEAVPSGKRAIAAALVMMVASFVGQGLGPVAIGWASDCLLPIAGSQSLRFALLLAISLGSGFMIFAVWRYMCVLDTGETRHAGPSN